MFYSRRMLTLVWGVLALLGLPVFAVGQPGSFVPERRYELSGTVELDRADAGAVKALEQAKAYLADKQFNEGINILLQVMETSGGKLVGVTASRFIPLRDACQLQLVSLPRDALAVYRRRVDPEAKRLYEEGLAQRDRRRLMDVVDRYLAGSWADNALDVLGEMALESGDHASARSFWERIVPAAKDDGQASTRLGVPDTELDLAAVRARLVLASIVEGSSSRAGEELARFVKLHPDARGWLGGKQGRYAEALSALAAESVHWPRPQPRDDWPTFAGAPSRNAIAPKPADVAGPAWRVPLSRPETDRKRDWGQVGPPARVAEDARSPLSCFPVVSGGKVFINRGNEEILALDLASGHPAWGKSATVFAEETEGDRAKDPRLAGTLGVARFTATVFGDRLYARMGTPLTSRPRGASPSTEDGYLICLDLPGQGRLLWKIVPERGWAFEGSPVADAANVYVAMRRNEVQPQAHVACFDAQTGQLLWRRFVCAADTPARGGLPEITHNLLALHGDTVFVSTNLGAVAAVNVWDGLLRWVSLYPRNLKGDLARPPAHTCRDLTPCVYNRGTLYVAPADARSIFALDAVSGQFLWQSGPELEDAIHLLGVSHDCLIASGSRLYWISLKEPEQGRLKHVWPDGAAKLGYGRGLLAGDCVLWPTREKIYQFDQASGRLRKAIDLKARQVHGGNLLVAGGRLLIATPDALVALGEPAVPTKKEPPTVAEQMRRAVEQSPRSHVPRGNVRAAALRREPDGTQSVPARVPTRSVGTRMNPEPRTLPHAAPRHRSG